MNLNNHGCSASDRKLKGFTLIELIIVIAIIGILSAITTNIITGFRRDSMLETYNDNARVVYTAFQDILVECEITQNKLLFDAYDYQGDCGDITGALVFFRISQKGYNGLDNMSGSTGLGDEIHVITSYTDVVENFDVGWDHQTMLSVWPYGPGVGQNLPGYSGYNDYDYPRSTYGQDGGEHLWEKINTALTGRIDPKMEGTYYVMLDLNDYRVVSVICRNLTNGGADPKTGIWDPAEVTLTGGLNLQPYCEMAEYVDTIEGGQSYFPFKSYFIKNKEVERTIARVHGVFVGAYPLYDDLYTASYTW